MSAMLLFLVTQNLILMLEGINMARYKVSRKIRQYEQELLQSQAQRERA